MPGSFELPIAARKLAATGRCDSIICIGCVLRGETSHYDYVARRPRAASSSRNWIPACPSVFCVLTCDTLEQAIDRAGLKNDNKGYETGIAAVDMARLSRKYSAKSRRSGKARDCRARASARSGPPMSFGTNRASSPCRCFSNGT